MGFNEILAIFDVLNCYQLLSVRDMLLLPVQAISLPLNVLIFLHSFHIKINARSYIRP